MLSINSENFKKEVESSDLPVLIDFWASWCGPCQMMAPVFEELSRDYAGKLKFAKCDTEESGDLATRYDVSGIPCLILTKNGKEISRIVGFAPKDEIKARIDEIMKKL